MTNYAVTKNFGHFQQVWRIRAETESEAWCDAEKNGELQYQFFFDKETDVYSLGHVKNLDEETQETPIIPRELYNQWLREAIDKGMIVTPEEHKQAFGLPFVNVW